MSVAAALVAISALVIASWMRAAGTAIARIPRADALRDASDDISGAEQVAEPVDEGDSDPILGAPRRECLASTTRCEREHQLTDRQPARAPLDEFDHQHEEDVRDAHVRHDD